MEIPKYLARIFKLLNDFLGAREPSEMQLEAHFSNFCVSGEEGNFRSSLATSHKY
jgi:hypothetical protein